MPDEPEPPILSGLTKFWQTANEVHVRLGKKYPVRTVRGTLRALVEATHAETRVKDYRGRAIREFRLSVPAIQAQAASGLPNQQAGA